MPLLSKLVRSVSVTGLCLFLSACAGPPAANGGSSATAASKTYPQVLNGTWHLFGDDKQLAPYSVADRPALSVGIGVSPEGLVYASGMFVPKCTGNQQSPFGLVLTGKVDSLGALRMSESGAKRLIVTSTSSPGAAGGNWIGTYTYDFAAGTLCTDRATGSGTFTATALPSATGTYTGTVDQYYPVAQDRMAMSVALTQSKNDPAGKTGYAAVPYPVVAGTITVSTPSCTLTGSTVFPAPMDGDYSQIPFSMSDGSTLFVDAAFPVDGRPTVQAQVGIENMTCKGGYYGTLNRK